MATQATLDASTAAQLNQELDAVGAAVATQLTPAHAEAINDLAKEEPAVFNLVMELVHSFHKAKRGPKR